MEEQHIYADTVVVFMNDNNDDIINNSSVVAVTTAERGQIESEGNANTINIAKNNTDKHYECDYCNKIYKTRDSLIRHFKHKHNDMITTTHTGIQYSCSISDKTFVGNCDLQKHMRLHTAKNPYSCNRRDKSFQPKPHLCNICGKAYAQRNEYRTHLSVHAGEKPFSCKICNRAFGRSHHRNEHELIHTGGRPYICTICNVGFNRNSHLKIHNRIHTGEKAYACKICDMAFSYDKYLKKHMLIHTGE